MTVRRGVAHVTEPVTAVAESLPAWVTLVRAPNPGPLTLDGTNTWVLRGDGGAVVIDPGPEHEQHLLRVAEAAGPVSGVLITHRHADHVGGLARFQELTGAPVLAGERAVPSGLAITTVPSPGHTADSACFLVESGDDRLIFTGDTILGRGTTVVAWPDGDLGDYLTSLRRLAGLGSGLPALPGHGPPLADCATACDVYLAHRRGRLEQVAGAVAAGAGTVEDVVAQVYGTVDAALWPAAERTVRAQLEFLRRQRESSTGPAPLDEP